MFDDGHQSTTARALLGLPEVVQNALVFSEILLRIGFQPEAITFEHLPASKFGLSGDSDLLMGMLRDGRLEFGYALGLAIPRVDQLLEQANALWDAADRRSQGVLWEASRLTKHQHLFPLLETILRQGFQLPNLLDPGRPSQVSEMNPRKAAAGPAPVPRSSPRFELGKVKFDDDAMTKLATVDLAPFLERHVRGDWGAAEFPEENEAALHLGLPLLSAYRTATDVDFWIVTSTDRKCTSIRTLVPPVDLGPIPRDLVCRYIGTGTRAEIQAQQPRGELHSLPLAELEGPTAGGSVERVAAELGRVITDNAEARRRTAYPEQMVRALWRCVLNLDLRPLDGKGRRIPGSYTSRVMLRDWMHAKWLCRRRGIRAWFAVSYEPRLS